MQETIPIYLQDFFRVLMLHSPIGIFMVNARGQNLFVNDRFCVLAGTSHEKAIGKNWYNAIHPEDVFTVLTEWQAARQNGTEFSAEFRFLHKTNEVQWVAVSALMLRDETGTVQGALGNITDLNARKKSDQFKNEFSATVSHELRTPLTAIRGSLGLVLGGVAGPVSDQAKPLLQMALTNCERLVRLINDILDIEKMESGKMDFKLESLDLIGLVRHALATNQPLAEAAKIRFVLVTDHDTIKIEGDQDRLIQVLTNLLSNASKYSPEAADVTISITKNEETVRVAVSDSGRGIPHEFHSRIFQKFTQADSSDTRPKGGTGLGLNISKAIVEQLGGSIGFSTELGKGTTFYFDLPLERK